MRYSESPEQASEYLRLALKLVGRLKLGANPINYALCYEYVSGMNQALKDEMDARVRSGQPYSNEAAESLYMTHIAVAGEARNHSILKEIHRLLLEMTDHVMTADSEVTRHESNLREKAVTLAQQPDIARLKDVVREIIDETRGLLESGESLKERLVATSRELDELKEELERTREKATTDGLTGIANRLAFEKKLAEEVSRSTLTGTPLCMLFADIDFFKRFNDNYGHLVGDMVLKMAAAMMKGFIRGNDFAARYGGEEFVVLLPNTSLEGAVTVAETIRSFFEAKKWRAKDSGKSIGSITFSLGVARHRPGETGAEFLRRADMCLYQSKARGRNRVTCETEMADSQA